MIPRRPSPERVLRYVAEEMIDGATVDAVMAGNARRDRVPTLVRWRVCARLRADGYSYPGIASRLGIDHATVIRAVRLIAEGRTPWLNTGKNGHPPKKPRPPKPVRLHRRTKPRLIRFAGYEPTGRFKAAKLSEEGRG